MLSFILGRTFAKLLTEQLAPVNSNLRSMMSTLAEVQASQKIEDAEITALIAQGQSTAQALADVSAQLAALQAQGGASPADLDAVKADIDAEAAAMAAVLPAPPGATGSTGSTGSTGP